MKYSLNDITGFLYSKRNDSESTFDSLYQDRLQESYEEFIRLFNAIQKAHEDEERLHEGTLNAGLMLWGSLQGTFVALQILRFGNWRESSIMLRTPLENAAVALFLHENPKYLEPFRKGKHVYGMALQLTRKLIRTFKGECELLSQIYVHPCSLNGVINIKDGRLVMEAQFESDKSHRYEMSLLNIERTLVNLGMITEIIFSDYFDELQYWKKEGEELIELPPHSRYLERFFRQAELVKEQMGINMLEGQEKATEILKRVLEIRKRKEAEKPQSIPTKKSDK